MVTTFAPIIYLHFNLYDKPSSQPMPDPSHIPGSILCHDQSLIISGFPYPTLGTSVIPTLDTLFNHTYHPTFIPKLLIQTTLKTFCTKFSGLACGDFFLYVPTPICLDISP